MALLINYSKFLPRFIGVVCQRGIKSGHGRIFSLRASPAISVRLNETFCRSTVTLAEHPDQGSSEPHGAYSVEDMVYRLSEDLRIRNVFFNDVMDVFSAVKEKGKITDSQFMLFMRCCSGISLLSTPLERVQFAEKVWVEAVKSGTKFTIAHYNALLNVFVECNHMFSSSQFLKNIRDNGLEPNSTTFKELLKAYCQRGDSKGVNIILAEMKNNNLPLSVDEFTRLIQCYAITGDFDKCKEILKLMDDKDIDPSPWAYTNLLCGYAKHGKIQELKETLEMLPEKCVKFSNLQLAEIVYSLVSNNLESHIQLVLDKMTPNFSDNKLTLRVIHRLIREKYDSAAFKLFEKLNTIDITSDSVLINSKLILKHFALYREPDDIITAINVMKGKGWIQTGLSVVLRQIYQYKDEDFCVDFFRTMRKLQMPVKSHYFWPLLIKASKKSNSKVWEILDYMGPNMLQYCQCTTTKILYLHYNFSKNWLADFDSLYKLGCPVKWLSITCIKVLAEMNAMKEAVKVAATYPVDIRQSSDIFMFLVDHIQNHPDQVSDFVDILYYLGHDIYLKKEKEQLDEGRDLEEVKKNETADQFQSSVYEDAVFRMIKFLSNEKVAQMILEDMIEKKIGISSKKTATLRRFMPPECKELIEKLGNLEFKFKLNENVLKSKKSWTSNARYERRKTKREEQNLKENLPVTPYVTVLYLSRVKNFNKLKLVLSELKGDPEVKQSLWRSIYEWYKKQEQNVGEELYKMTVDFGVFSEEDRIKFIRFLLTRNFATEAVKLYAEFAEEKKNVPKFLEFLTKLAQQDDQAPTYNFIDIISMYISENIVFTSLAIAYATVGKLEKAREIIEHNDFTFISRILYKHIRTRFNFLPSNTLENFLQLIKSNMNIDRVLLYKFLVLKYAEEKKLNKIKDLWLLIEEDDICNYNFLEQVRDLVDNPSEQALEQLAEKFKQEESSVFIPVDEVTKTD